MFQMFLSTVVFDEITVSDFNNLLHEKGVTVIDVCEPGEQPVIDEFEHLQMPVSRLKETTPLINGEVLITVWQSGKRSRLAAQRLAIAYPTKKYTVCREALKA